EGQHPEPLTSARRTPLLPAPTAGHDPLPGGRVKDAYGAGYAGRAPARSLTRPPDRRTGSYRGAGSRPRHTQIRAATPPRPPIDPLAITGRYRSGGYRVQGARRTVTVGDEAAVPGPASQCPSARFRPTPAWPCRRPSALRPRHRRLAV